MASADHFQAAVRLADRRAESVERSSALPLLVVAALYWTFTCTFAFRKLMWNDELYTYYIARLPTMHDVVGALMSGGEQTPPFFYLTTRASLHLFGINNIAIRLPEMLAVFVMMLCLFRFVRRTSSVSAALCAALFPIVTKAYGYSFEARPYGLVLGFGALAIVSWQAATLEGRSRWTVVCLTVAVAAAASSHYYGVFLALPLVVGEIVRTVTRRRLDAAIWVALGISVVPLLWHLPLIKAGTAYSSAFWAPPQWVNLPDFYSDLLHSAIVPIVCVLTIGVIVAVTAAEFTPAPDDRSTSPPIHELAAACALVALPAVCVVLAKLVTGAFVNRYALAAVLGLAMLAGWALELAFRPHAAVRLIAVVCFGGWFVLSQAREVIQPTGDTLPVSPALIQRSTDWLGARPERELPIVVADPQTFVVLSHYARADIGSRLVYLADPKLALQYLGHNSVERGMIDLVGPWFRMPVVAFDRFLAEHRRFLVYGDFVRLSFLNWLLPELHARGIRTELLNRAGDTMLLLVSNDAAATSTTVSSDARAAITASRAMVEPRR